MLIPTESPSPQPERTRPSGLQAFLETSEEEDTYETDTDSESNDEAAVVGGMQDARCQQDSESDSEGDASASTEEDSGDDEEEGVGASLVQSDESAR